MVIQMLVMEAVVLMTSDGESNGGSDSCSIIVEGVEGDVDGIDCDKDEKRKTWPEDNNSFPQSAAEMNCKYILTAQI